MIPRRVVKRRKQSKPARHTNAAPHACVGNLRLSIEQNPAPAFLHCDELVVVRCVGCNRIVDARGVLPTVDDCA